MAEQKVVVKLNYPQTKAATQAPDTITVWHIKRIVIVVTILFLVLAGVVYVLLKPDLERQTGPADVVSVEQSMAGIQPAISIDADQPQQSVSNREIATVGKTRISGTDIKAVPQQEKNISINKTLSKVKTETVIVEDNETQRISEIDNGGSVVAEKSINTVYDPHILRAVIASQIVEKEPVNIIDGPVTVIKERATGVFFFTEIKDMKGEILYHEWLRNGELVFKRKINVLNNRWRAATSKLITYYRKGLWKVRLVDGKGKELSVISFNVIQK